MLEGERELLRIIKGEKRPKTIDIVERSKMSKVTVLKHLESLRDSGLIDYERAGPTKLWFCSGGLKREPEEIIREVQKLLKSYEELTGKKTFVIFFEGEQKSPLAPLLKITK